MFVKNRNLEKKIDIFVINRYVCQKSIFLSNVEKLSKIEILVKKSKFLSKKNQNFAQTSNCLANKIQFWSKIEKFSAEKSQSS